MKPLEYWKNERVIPVVSGEGESEKVVAVGNSPRVSLLKKGPAFSGLTSKQLAIPSPDVVVAKSTKGRKGRQTKKEKAPAKSKAKAEKAPTAKRKKAEPKTKTKTKKTKTTKAKTASTTKKQKGKEEEVKEKKTEEEKKKGEEVEKKGEKAKGEETEKDSETKVPRMRGRRARSGKGKGRESEDIKDEDKWTENQEVALLCAYNALNPSLPNFWARVAGNVPGEKTANDCQKRYEAQFPTPNATRTLRRRPRSIPKPVLPSGKAPLKRRKVLRQMLERVDVEHGGDDLFDATPMKKQLGGVDYTSPTKEEDPFAVDMNIDTEGEEDDIERERDAEREREHTDDLLTRPVNRDQVDIYVNRLKKVSGTSGYFVHRPQPRSSLHSDLDTAYVKNAIAKTKVSKADDELVDSEEEEDYYFSDKSDAD